MNIPKGQSLLEPADRLKTYLACKQYLAESKGGGLPVQKVLARRTSGAQGLLSHLQRLQQHRVHDVRHHFPPGEIRAAQGLFHLFAVSDGEMKVLPSKTILTIIPFGMKQHFLKPIKEILVGYQFVGEGL